MIARAPAHDHRSPISGSIFMTLQTECLAPLINVFDRPIAVAVDR